MTLTSTVLALVDHVAALAAAHVKLVKHNEEAHLLMATRADLDSALTQLEAALRATVATIGTAVSDLAAKVEPAMDMAPEMQRITAATQMLTQLAEAVQAAGVDGTGLVPHPPPAWPAP